MKKWILHNVACAVNAVGVIFFAVVFLMQYFQYLAANRGINPSREDKVTLILFIFAVIVYLLFDYNGLRRSYKYNNMDGITANNNGFVVTMLVLQGLVQIGTGFLLYSLLSFVIAHPGGRYSSNLFFGFAIIFLLVFLTAVISFITTIRLISASRKKLLQLRDEISDIGSAVSHELP